MTIISDKDQGYSALTRRLETMRGRRLVLSVGVMNPGAPHIPALHGATVKEPGRGGLIHRLIQNRKRAARGAPTVGQVAQWIEFGTSRSPARPFVRTYWDQNSSRLAKRVSKGMPDVLRGRITFRALLESVGKIAAEGMKAVIIRRIPPPNAESTVKRKGSDIPGIDTGQMLNAIGSRVAEDGK